VNNNKNLVKNKIGRLKSVFPNPASDHLTIQFDLNESANVQFKLFNNLGQEILTGKRSHFDKGLQETSLSLYAVEKGMYILQMVADQMIQDGKKVSVIK